MCSKLAACQRQFLKCGVMRIDFMKTCGAMFPGKILVDFAAFYESETRY